MTKSSAAFGSLCALLCIASPAAASDWKISSRLTQLMELNDNYFMARDSLGPTVRSLSTVYLDSIYRTSTTRHVLSGDLSYYKYMGPGAEDVQMKSGITNGARYGFERYYKSKNDIDTLNIIWRRSDVATDQLEDVGTITSRGSQNTYIIDGGVTRQLNARDTVSLLSRGTANSFENEEQNFTDLLGSVRYSHVLTPLTQISANADFDFLKYSDPQNTQTQFWKLLGGFLTRPTSQLTVRGSLGMAFAKTTADESAMPIGAGNNLPPPPPPLPGDPPIIIDSNAPPPLDPVQRPGSAQSWIGDLFITYVQKTTTYNLFAYQYISPNTTGALTKRKSVGFSVREQINQRSAITFASTYGQSSSGIGPNASETANLNFLASYDYSITRELRAQFVYNYRRNFTETSSLTSFTDGAFPPIDNSPITSHGVYVVLSKDVTIKP